MGINEAYIKGYSDSIIGVINVILVPTLIALAFIVFLWGVYNYFIYGADNEDKRKEGRTFVLYGVIGFVIIFSLWALVNILMGTLGLGPSKSPPPPTIGGSGTPSAAVSNPLGGAVYSPPVSGGASNPNDACAFGTVDGTACTISGESGSCVDGVCRPNGTQGENF